MKRMIKFLFKLYLKVRTFFIRAAPFIITGAIVIYFAVKGYFTVSPPASNILLCVLVIALMADTICVINFKRRQRERSEKSNDESGA